MYPNMNPPGNNRYNGAGADSRGQDMMGKPYQLSANAAEFVPRFGPPSQMPQQQNGMDSRGGNMMMYQQQQQQQQQQMQGPGQIPNVRQQQINTTQIQLHQTMLQHQQEAQQQAQQQYLMQQNMQQMSYDGGRGGYGGGHGGGHGGHGGGRGGRGGQSNYNYHQGGGRGGGHSHSSQQSTQPPSMNPQDPLAQIKQAIIILTKDESAFDSTVPDLTSNLSTTIQTEEKLVKMVEQIFRQSTEEANFRYTGARICNYFSHHLAVQFNNQGFKHLLLTKVAEEHKKREDLVSNCDNRYKLVGFTLYMGELLLNMNDFTKTDDTKEYVKVLSKCVQELLQSLLTQPADDTLRCVVQVLKLCGGMTEDTEKSINEDESTPELDKIFTVIKTAILEESYIKSLRAQMLSVIELRASNWGRQDSDGASGTGNIVPGPPVPSHIPQQPNPYTNVNPEQGVNPYYPGQAGMQGDVPGFGSTGFYPDDMYFYSSGDDEFQNQEELFYMYNGELPPEPDDMDPEIEAAFEEFLQTQ